MAAGMSNNPHLATGSEEPSPPAKDVLRVYGMKLCPYVHRLKLVLAAKGVEHETVNINLSNKPEWYLKNKNPRGQVPCMELNGEIIFESDITSTFVDETYPGRKLTTSDPLKKAKEGMLMGDHSKVVSGFYGSAFVADEAARGPALIKLKEGLEAFEKYFEKNGYPFVCGDQAGFTDYMIWPHLERVGAFAPICISQFPRVQAYFDAMGKDEAVIKCRWSNEVHRKFVEGARIRKVDYDALG